MTSAATAKSFRLSRVYAQGWNSARGPKGTGRDNPYPADPERGRWQAGFVNAQTIPTRKAK